jgi:DNA polymerase-3 subunit alpha
VLDNLCNAHCTELADRCAALVDREDITLGCIVTGIQTRFSAKTNKPWGIVTLEDFEGSGELVLFGDDWLNLNGKFIEGAAVYVTGKMQSRFYNNDQKELKVSNVELLQTVKERAVDRITISMVADQLDEQIVADLSEIIHSCPGKTKLFFQLRDSKGEKHVLLHSKNSSVDVRHTLIDYIEQHDMLDYKIN